MKTIRRGDRGLAVSDVQKRLVDQGFAAPGLDAEIKEACFGNGTVQAVRAFQQERGLRAEGEVDETTWQELVEASFRLGDRFLYLRVPPFRGDDVREVQRYLNRLGFNAGREDGIFGQDTDRALRAFQHNMALPVDGIAGASTISCLQRLRHALKDTSVAEVHEALQDLATRGLEGRSVVLDAAEGDADAEEMLRLVSGELLASGLSALITGGVSGSLPERRRARLANDLGADLVLGLRAVVEPGLRVFFFGSKGYSSPRGRRLAELICREIGSLAVKAAPFPEARSHPLLRETRMPCVIVEAPPELDPRTIIVPALTRSIIFYFAPGE